MTFRTLVERLSGTSGNGAGAVLEYMLDDYCVTNNDSAYYSISGFLWGLVGVGYVSMDERSALIDSLSREDFEF